MTIETETFNTLDEAKQAKLRSGTRHRNGWVSINTDFINNQWEVKWANGLDDPQNDPVNIAKRVQQKTNSLRKEVLENKPNITLPEMQELLRLSF